MKNTFSLFIIYSILILFFYSCSCETNTEVINNINIKQNNMVNNHIKNFYIENIIYAGLSELKIDSVVVNIYYLHENLKRVDIDNTFYIVNAMIIENAKNNYSIFINENSINNNIKLYISHELIHLDQFNKNRLNVNYYLNVIVFDNKIYNTLETDYGDRPWEAEAFRKEEYLKSRIEFIYF